MTGQSFLKSQKAARSVPIGFAFKTLDAHLAAPVAPSPSSCLLQVQGSGLAVQAHRLLYHSTLGSRVIMRKKKVQGAGARHVLGAIHAPRLPKTRSPPLLEKCIQYAEGTRVI